MGGGEGRDGDWECNGCGNRNYAFRSFCNRCKQPRLLVDPKSHADSKWLPRIGDWICTVCVFVYVYILGCGSRAYSWILPGVWCVLCKFQSIKLGCTNNNYASREKCKKCGEPKEVAALPAHAMPYFPQGVQDHRFNIGLLANGGLPLNPNWLLAGGNDKFSLQAAITWPTHLGATVNGIGNSHNTPNPLPYINQATQVMVQKGWRNGDWICACGFHNYASRAQCKKCNASMPPALGTKRLASEELVQDWDNKRLNAGQRFEMQHSYPILSQLPSSSYSSSSQMANFVTNQGDGVYPLQLSLQTPQMVTMATTLPGKGCNTQREGPSLSVGVA